MLLFIRATFCVLLVSVAICSVFRLFWLSCQYLPSAWLERLPRKPNHGEGIVSTKPRPKIVYDFIGLVYCFIILWCVCFVPWPYVIYFIPLRHDIA